MKQIIIIGLVCGLFVAVLVGAAVVKVSSARVVGLHSEPNNWRPAFIELNTEFFRASNALAVRGIQTRTNMEFLNVGSGPNSGDGDLISDAVKKSARNVAILRKALQE